MAAAPSAVQGTLGDLMRCSTGSFNALSMRWHPNIALGSSVFPDEPLLRFVFEVLLRSLLLMGYVANDVDPEFAKLVEERLQDAAKAFCKREP